MNTTENRRADALTPEEIQDRLHRFNSKRNTTALTVVSVTEFIIELLAASPVEQPAAAPTIKQRLGSGTPSGHYWMRRDDRWYVIQVKDGHYRHCGASADIPLQDALALPIIPIQEPYPAPAPAAEQVAIPAGWLNEDRMSEIARKCEIECQAIPGTNMWQCAHMAVEETLRALAEPHMSMLIAEVCEDADGYKHIEAVIEDLDDLPKGMKLYAAPQPPAQATLGVLTPQMMAAGMFVKRSTFGPWIEVDKEEPGVVRLYHAPAQENARVGLMDAVVDAAKAVVREALDSVSVHPCDEHDDEVRARQLPDYMQKLYRALLQGAIHAE